MKKNIILKVNGLTSSSKSILLFCLFAFLSPILMTGQRVKKSITKEISISENAVIKIQGPQSVRITGNGAINTRQIKDQYIVSGKSSKPYIYMIHKTMQIESWEKSNVKQVVNVVLDCEKETEAEQLLEALDIELEENAAGSIRVNCELNIAKFKIENGWFSADDNHVILNSGKRYSIKYLELSTILYVPINSRMELETSETDVVMNTHQGDLNLRINGGSFTAKKIKKTKAEFSSVQVDIDTIHSGTLNIKDCVLNLDNVYDLAIESAISNFKITAIESLLIEETLNDHFEIGSLGKISVAKSRFSNFDIRTASESIDMTLRNGDINVATLGVGLKFVTIKNQHAKVDLGVQQLQTYQVNCQPINQSKYKLPKKMKVVQKSENEKEYQFGANPEQTKIEIDCSQCEVNLGHFSS